MKIAWTINVHPTVNVTENLIGPFGTGSKGSTHNQVFYNLYAKLTSRQLIADC